MILTFDALSCIPDLPSFLKIGVSNLTIEEAIDSCIPILDRSGLDYVIHAGGFTIDAEWKLAMDTIGQLHQHLHDEGFVRVHSDLRVGTRTDKDQTMKDKVDTVENKLNIAK